MRHVDDWLDDPANKAHPAREFLEHARRPAAGKDHKWLTANMPTVSWRGGRFLCVGASRMGDVWLREFNLTGAFYDHRVDITELSDWTVPSPVSES